MTPLESPAYDLSFGQPWQPALAAGFHPGTVHLVRRGDVLEVTARLSDPSIVDPPAKFNDYAYTKGDVFELFIMAEGDDHYHEIHVTPSNVLLQLCFPYPAVFPLKVEAAKVWEPLLESSTERFDGGWIARYRCPLSKLTPARPIPTRWRIGCGRYDYPALGEPAVISNTAPLTVASFHRHDEWPVYDFGLNAVG